MNGNPMLWEVVYPSPFLCTTILMPEEIDLKLHRILAYSLSCLALALSIFAYQELRFIGFPDGFVSEEDNLRKSLFALFIGVSLVASFGFMVLGWISARKDTRKILTITGISYGVFMALMVIADHDLSQRSGFGG